MELQFLNDGIDFRLLLKARPALVDRLPMLAAHYDEVAILNWQREVQPATDAALRRDVRNYYISYTEPGLSTQSATARMSWLRDHVLRNAFWTNVS